MKTFWELSYEDKFKRTLHSLPAILAVLVIAHFLFKMPLWGVLLIILLGISQLIYYNFKRKNEKQ